MRAGSGVAAAVKARSEATSFTTAGLPSHGTFYFVVRARDRAGNEDRKHPRATRDFSRLGSTAEGPVLYEGPAGVNRDTQVAWTSGLGGVASRQWPTQVGMRSLLRKLAERPRRDQGDQLCTHDNRHAASPASSSWWPYVERMRSRGAAGNETTEQADRSGTVRCLDHLHGGLCGHWQCRCRCRGDDRRGALAYGP
jgi:hypothetical protein